MGLKAYSLAQKAEAVALATVSSAEYAAEQLGIDARTVRRWLEKAGKAPAAAAPVGGWEQLLDLAMARVGSALSTNKVRPKDAAVIAAIATRNIREPKPAAPPPSDVETAVDVLEAELGPLYPGHVDRAFIALIDGLDDADEATREVIIADPIGYLASLGDLEEWRNRRMAEDHERMVAQLAKNERSKQAAMTAALDRETQDLVAAAEAWLEATNDAA